MIGPDRQAILHLDRSCYASRVFSNLKGGNILLSVIPLEVSLIKGQQIKTCFYGGGGGGGGGGGWREQELLKKSPSYYYFFVDRIGGKLKQMIVKGLCRQPMLRS